MKVTVLPLNSYRDNIRVASISQCENSRDENPREHFPLAARCHLRLTAAARQTRAVPSGFPALFCHLPGDADDYCLPCHLCARQIDGVPVPARSAADCRMAVMLLHLAQW